MGYDHFSFHVAQGLQRDEQLLPTSGCLKLLQRIRIEASDRFQHAAVTIRFVQVNRRFPGSGVVDHAILSER
jgi:hypothetical protein